MVDEKQVSSVTSKTSNVKEELQSSDKNTATVISNGATLVVKDPMINIGCKQPGGILIDLSSRPAFQLKYGFNRYNKSIWEMIVADGHYKELMDAGIIYLSKNG